MQLRHGAINAVRQAEVIGIDDELRSGHQHGWILTGLSERWTNHALRIADYAKMLDSLSSQSKSFSLC